MQYSKQAHQILVSSDEKKLFFFLYKVKSKSDLKKLLWENEHGHPYVLLLISDPEFIAHNLYFL